MYQQVKPEYVGMYHHTFTYAKDLAQGLTQRGRKKSSDFILQMNKPRKRDRDRKSDSQAERERENCHLPRAVFHTEAMNFWFVVLSRH